VNRILIVGCGRVAQHYKNISNKIFSNNNKIVAVCDTKVEKAKLFASYYNCNYYSDINKAINKEYPNLVILLTPSGSHFDLSKLCLEKNINTITEKPMCLKIDECKKLIRFANKKNILFGTVFQNRFNPAVIYTSKILKKKYLGKIVTANIRLRWARYQDYYDDGWHGTWKYDGGVISQQCIHHIDIINFLNGPIKEICSYGNNLINKLEAEDTAICLMKFYNNSMGTLEATTAARPNDIEASISIIGDKGHIDISGIALNKITDVNFIGKNFNKKMIMSNNSQKVSTGYGLGHIPFFKILFKNLKNNKIQPPVDPLTSLETTKIVNAIYKSNEEKRWIKVDNKALSSKLGN
tara:strand:+ start:7600 stop:8655 length:1056 start_codon:yes stop_codon:yes gene_type:complete